MTKAYSVAYNIRSIITIYADSKEEAKKKFYDPDQTTTEELLKDLEANIGDLGNDAIEIDDIWEE